MTHGDNEVETRITGSLVDLFRTKDSLREHLRDQVKSIFGENLNKRGQQLQSVLDMSKSRTSNWFVVRTR